MRAFLPFFLLIGSLFSSEEKGLAIATKIDRANKGFKAEKGVMKMILVDSYGNKVEREMESLTREDQQGNKNLLIFRFPLDVKGTKLLTWAHKEKDDDQWIYLPRLKKVRRISSKGRSGPFMGSEFSYEDFGGQELEKFNYLYLKEEKLKGHLCWVIQRTPKLFSGYQKQKVWFSQKLMNPLKITYFNRRGEPFKTATFEQHKQYQVQNHSFFRSHKVIMENTQTRKKTFLEWSERAFGLNLKDSLFGRHRLKR